MNSKRNWQSILLLAAGIFIGSYWLMDGYLSVLNLWKTHLHLQSVFPLFPGIAILALVLLAQRAPVPYGTGLIVLGVMALVFFSLHNPITRVLLLGIPLILVGTGFLIWRGKVRPAGQD